MFNKGDFHLHTTASDGRQSPSDVVKLAAKHNFDIIAITDHDTVSGIEEARDQAEELGMTVIAGIELSTYHNNESVHVLGFFKDDAFLESDLISYLDDIQTRRYQRAKTIIANLKEFHDIEIEYEKVMALCDGGIMARPHIAQAIIDAGYDYSWEYIFDNIIGDDCPAFVPTVKMSTEEGIALLHKHNAVAVLAHPCLLKKNPVEDVVKLGFDGIEGIYSLNEKDDESTFRKLAHKYDMFVTAGSDYHGIHNDGKHAGIDSVCLKGNDLIAFLQKLI